MAGTVAVVTGASSGIGEATARRLAEHGASVAAVARRKDRLDTLVTQLEAAGSTALAVEADITDRTQAERAVHTVVDCLGRLDILINNAGLMLLGPVVGADIGDWERMIALNQKGLLYVTNAALPHLPSPSTRIGAIVGDVIHNLRSALDVAAWQLAIAHDEAAARRKRNQVSFPLTGCAAEFKKPHRALQFFSEPAREVIERLQPYQRSMEALGWLRDLSNADKHRVATFSFTGFAV